MLERPFRSRTVDTEMHDPHAPAASQETPNAADHPTAVYVEDNAINLRLMEAVFKSRPAYRLITAPTAEEGLRIAWSESIQLVLMDINLPGMNGYEALEALRADDRTVAVPIVAMTSDAMLGDAERGLAAGFDEYVTKPIDVLSFFDLLDRYLGDGPASG